MFRRKIPRYGDSLCDLADWFWRGSMPLTIDTYLSPVRITSAGDLLGTGFLVSMPSEQHTGQYWPFLVTAHHVILNQIEVCVEIPDPFTGDLHPPHPVEGWEQPLDEIDLALAPYQGPANVPIRT